MRKPANYIILCVVAAVLFVLTAFFSLPYLRTKKILSAYQPGKEYGGVTIEHPFDRAVFPPDIAAPVFDWYSDNISADSWLVVIRCTGGRKLTGSVRGSTKWTPGDRQWRKIKRLCAGKSATVTVLGVNGSRPGNILCAASIDIEISGDPVDAPIFYRDVNLPFIEAVKDPTSIQWRLGYVSSSEQPPVVLEKLPVCGNCHSFSRDGKVLGMDVDYANDKGSYAIAPVTPEIVLTKDKLITWSDYKREDDESTFGLLSQVSPDGRYVIGTVKDRSVFVATPGLEFSQLFFPIQGILALYDRQTGEFKALPGADDPGYVQSNPAWSPDGRTIVFARSRSYELKNLKRKDNILLTLDECREFQKDGKTFLYDLYSIPFNNGNGGRPEPLKGASQNGKSNYFAKYSPDGKWIVFCRAGSFMLLQPDSELFIIPAEGGEARKLECNTSRMNSWHSWSPNGRWIVFSSKTGTPYTRLFIAHMDEQGISSPPVLLSNFTSAGRAANIPEFVNMGKTTVIRRISEHFIDDVSFLRAGNAFFKGGDIESAIGQYRKAIQMNPGNVEALVNMASTLSSTNRVEEAIECLRKAVTIDPTSAEAFYNLAIETCRLGNVDEAIRYSSESVRLDPGFVLARSNLGMFLVMAARIDEAIPYLEEALRLDPEKSNTHFALGRAMVQKNRLDEAVRHYSEAVRLSPEDPAYLNVLSWILATAPDPGLRNGQKAVELATRLCMLTKQESPRPLDILGASYAETGQFSKAVSAAEKAMYLAQKQGDLKLASEIQIRINLYRQNKPFHQ